MIRAHEAWRHIQKVTADSYHTFIEAMKKPQETQEKVLKAILKNNINSEMGKKYSFNKIDSIESFQRQLPIQSQDKFQADTSRMTDGEENILISHPIFWYEKTSGTSSHPKLIAFTEPAINSLQSALFPWLYDLCSQQPAIKQGKAYWSISPAGQIPYKTNSGIAVGVDNDAYYFGQEMAELLKQTMSVPAWVSQVQSIDAWHYISLRYLLSDADLTLISIWSPTFLLQLFEALPKHVEQLIDDIRKGQVSNSELNLFSHHFNFKPNPQRAKLLMESITTKSIDTQRIWPKLSLISCWASASSLIYAQQLQKLFTGVAMQAKGLLATEGAITIPLFDANNPVLALLSGFYEFVAEDGKIYLADEIVVGEQYSVLMTNNSGLYRYHIGDCVKVIDRYFATPCLEFMGRSGANTDLCGEKLTEAFVLPLLKCIPGFTLLVAESLPVPNYCLYVDAEKISSDQQKKLEESLDQSLQKNPHYKYARHLKQLKKVKIIRTINPLNSYYQQLNNVTELGNIKPPCLSQDMAWHDCFNVCGEINDE
jgi:hypothetical protein